MIDPPAAPLGFAALPEGHRARIEAELAPGERLLWAAQPDFDRPNGPRRSDASFAVWMVAWFVLGLTCLLSVLLLSGTRVEGGQLLLLSIAVVAEVIAFLMAVSYGAAFVRIGPRRRRLSLYLYALTDRRALIWEPDQGSPALSVRQYPAGSLRPELIERIEFPDGSGSMLFSRYRRDDDGFHAIKDVRALDTLIRRYLVDPKPTPIDAPDPNSDDYEEPF